MIICKDQEELSNALKHSEALEETGFWGRRAAGSIMFAMSTGRLLLALRSEEVLEPGTWGTWGGACDEGESPADTAFREATEESGTPTEAIIALIASFVFKHKSGFEYHNFIAVVADEYEPELNWETASFAWLDLEELPENLHPGLVTFLESEIFSEQLHELQELHGRQSKPNAGPRP